MHIKTATFLKEVADEVGIESEVYEGYSGRAMYGKTTTGIVTKDAIALLGEAINWVAGDCGDYDFPADAFSGLKTDSMERDQILY